ncbi:hypothetical protein A2U01_0087771, partial [Trifolium medium]|nr:hypothetical protein [Trifolium medium]
VQKGESELRRFLGPARRAGGTGALRCSVHKQQESCLEGARCTC